MVRSPLPSPRISSLLRAQAGICARAWRYIRAGACGGLRVRTRGRVWWRLYRRRNRPAGMVVFVVDEPTLSKQIHSGVVAVSILIWGRGCEAQVIMAVTLAGDGISLDP
jgi:hypothetical protein